MYNSLEPYFIMLHYKKKEAQLFQENKSQFYMLLIPAKIFKLSILRYYLPNLIFAINCILSG